VSPSSKTAQITLLRALLLDAALLVGSLLVAMLLGALDFPAGPTAAS